MAAVIVVVVVAVAVAVAGFYTWWPNGARAITSISIQPLRAFRRTILGDLGN